jgi:3-phenylpropionate/trans-cinnamate dioxygenase ferredoxin subunit
MTVTRVCSVDDVAPDSSIRVLIGTQPIAIVRIGNDFYAIGDTCSHAEVSLSEGEVDPGDKHIECWKHGSRFSLESGEPDCLPATRPVPVYRVKVEGDDVLVELAS